MSTITTREIAANPEAFISRIEAGEALSVSNDARILADVTPVPLPLTELRPIGLYDGQVTIADDFDAPLPEDVLALFEGGS